jgi:hypothetical protein
MTKTHYKQQLLNLLKTEIYRRFGSVNAFGVSINEDVQNLYKALNGKRPLSLESVLFYLKKCNTEISFCVTPFEKTERRIKT